MSRPPQQVIRATCHFEDGHAARLPVTDLSEQGAFICSVRPPPIGSSVSLSLHLGTESPVEGLGARIVGVRLDPASAERSGFELRFATMPTRQLERLQVLLDRLLSRQPPSRRSERPSVPERRAQPRVEVDFLAEVSVPTGIATFRMRNLSLSGALLVLERGRLPAAIVPNAELPIQVISADVGDPLPLDCSIVRIGSSRSGRPVVAVRFTDMDEEEAAMLESLMLYSLIQRGFPSYPYDPS